MSWRRRQIATYWPKVLLSTIAALLSHLGWAAQQWVAFCLDLVLTPRASYLQLRLELNWPQLTQAVSGTWLYNCLTTTCFLWAYASTPNSTTFTGQGDIPISSTGCTCFAYLHRCISWLTARSRVNMLQGSKSHIYFYSHHNTNTKRGIIIGFYFRALHICFPKYLKEEFNNIGNSILNLLYLTPFIQFKPKTHKIPNRNRSRTAIITPNKIKLPHKHIILTNNSSTNSIENYLPKFDIY